MQAAWRLICRLRRPPETYLWCGNEGASRLVSSQGRAAPSAGWVGAHVAGQLGAPQLRVGAPGASSAAQLGSCACWPSSQHPRRPAQLPRRALLSCRWPSSGHRPPPSQRSGRHRPGDRRPLPGRCSLGAAQSAPCMKRTQRNTPVLSRAEQQAVKPVSAGHERAALMNRGAHHRALTTCRCAWMTMTAQQQPPSNPSIAVQLRS